MDEMENVGEEQQVVQPSIEENESCSPSEQDKEVVTEGETERGVFLGKFKSVDDLYSAYNNLEAEFTRKSQRLSELEKEKTQNQDSDAALHAFLSKNESAVGYLDELKSRVTEENADENAFEKAWAGILYEKLSSKDFAKEPFVQNMVLNDDAIQNMVIKNYYKQLQNQKAPVVISSNSGERVTTPAQTRPTSFEEAKRVAMELFKN